LGILSITDLARYLLKQTISSSSTTANTTTSADEEEKDDKHARDREQTIALTSEVWELFF
jgi:hypothetical protein